MRLSPVRIIGIAGYQMPASPVEIEPGVLAHNSLLLLLFRQPQFYFKTNRGNFVAIHLFGGSHSGRPSACQAG
jgi:hypothetical protein